MQRITLAICLLTLPMTACTTTSSDVAEAERTANEKTEKAYNNADEKALAANDRADEKTLKAVDEADRKIERADAEANKETDRSYNKAEKIEAKQDQKVEETRKKHFVGEMTKRLDSRKKDITKLAKKVAKSSAAAKKRDEPHLATLRDAQHTAEDLLNKVKKASWREWEAQKSGVQEAFANLDESLNKAKSVR